MPLLGSAVLPVNPAVPAEAVTILIPLLTALAKFGWVETNMLFHYKSSSFHQFPRRTSASAFDKSMLARLAAAQYRPPQYHGSPFVYSVLPAARFTAAAASKNLSASATAFSSVFTLMLMINYTFLYLMV